jgi:hypothetical protein
MKKLSRQPAKRKQQSVTLKRVIKKAASLEALNTPQNVGYMARLLIQAMMPHRKTNKTEHVRQNGDLSVCMLAKRDTGLPYGTYPRLILAGITTEVVANPSHLREIELGGLCEFMHSLGLAATGGKQGSIRRLRDHMKRLFSCSISWTYEKGNAWLYENISPVEGSELWWDPKRGGELESCSFVRLSVAFHREILAHSVPLDLDVLRALAQTRSPLALDIYSWLTYRMSYLTEPVDIPWTTLAMQFGSEYRNCQDFRKAFLEQLRIVKSVYPALNAVESPGGLTLWPSLPHVPKRCG